MSNFIFDYIKQYERYNYFSLGRAIYNKGSFKLDMLDMANGVAVVEIKAAYGDTQMVEISNFQHQVTNKIGVLCECSTKEDFCKHGIAALLALNEEIIKSGGFNTVGESKVVVNNPSAGKILVQKPIVEKQKPIINNTFSPIISKYKTRYHGINEWEFRSSLSKEDSTRVLNLAKTNRAKITERDDMSVRAEISFKGDTNNCYIKKLDDSHYESSCDCANHKKQMCMHRATVLLQLLNDKGQFAFELMRNWDSSKNKLLADYGFSVKDNLDGKFKFTINDRTGTLEMEVLDKSIMSMSSLAKMVQPDSTKQENTVAISDRAVLPSELERKNNYKKSPTDPDNRSVGFAFLPISRFPNFSIAPIMGRPHPEQGHFISHVESFLDYTGNVPFARLQFLTAEDYPILQATRAFSDNALSTLYSSLRAKQEYHYSTGYTVNMANQTLEHKIAIHNYISKNLRNLCDFFVDKKVYWNNDSNRFSINTIKEISIVNEPLTLHFATEETANFITLKGFLSNKNITIDLENTKQSNPYFVLTDNTLYPISVPGEGVEMLQMLLDRKKITVQKAASDLFAKNVIFPLQKHFTVLGNFKIQTATQQFEGLPIRKIYLKEASDALIIHPVVEYDSVEIELDEIPVHSFFDGEKMVEIERNVDFEYEFKALLEGLNPVFEDQRFHYDDGSYFWLEYNNFVENAWFLDFFEQMKAENIEVFGFSKLKKFKFNKNRGKFKMGVSSELDWFDIQAEVQFGEQVIGLKELRKAIVKKQNYVQLADGTLGILPQEWLEKYGAIFRIGQVKGDSLEVSKLHFSLVDQLYDQIDDEVILKELTEKRIKLKNFNNITDTQIPPSINATLRPYQKEGFNWLNFLDEFNWGGCLADDMGLGKTLQVITFLQHIKEKNGAKTNLVIAPTSLVYNWESEVAKFASGLTTLIYHGPDRKKIKTDDFKNYDIVISTYGTAASDIEKLKEFKFNYIVLDESQAIKNADTKRYKAMRLLQGKNRLCMSGTPVENNTFDLYAQFNFLNPGFLGSTEFFKEEYASAIDKHQDLEKTAELRKMVQPFMLRRTKELVADDLPEKTEIVLYCEMGKKQRIIYDSTKKKFKEKILGMIEERGGVQNAAMYVLEGLLRLRQICDSPALLNDDDLGDVSAESAKLDELMEHVTERTGKHKMLVFSQFKGMLALIRHNLEQQNIPFCYLDGSTSLPDRKKAVDKFQEDEKYRVFLISLKAGGTGLNLTAADYVYLMDPWWNPAVEQQAIDRAHRIGQKNHIFAYKMICKDSVEEKIIQLQDRKKSIAAELVTSDTGFMSSLSKNDIEFLFS